MGRGGYVDGFDTVLCVTELRNCGGSGRYVEHPPASWPWVSCTEVNVFRVNVLEY